MGKIRKKLIEDGLVGIIILVPEHFFYTVRLPVTLWFLSKRKKNMVDRERVLFIDARETYKQVDRAHREFTPQQIEFISNIVRLYKGRRIETTRCSSAMSKKLFPDLKYRDIKGLCKIATLDEIRKQQYSLNAGRYVGIETPSIDTSEFQSILTKSHKELERLNMEAEKIEEMISRILSELSG